MSKIGRMKALSEIVAENLAALRKKVGLTQQELADRLAYSDKTVSKWELGRAIP
ncbi:MAG: helix-turn-helix domain-containing protein, partial [Bacilli bacterium]|nr:helix-turn-helix domain-containing protein [Bacilli bacterium]